MSCAINSIHNRYSPLSLPSPPEILKTSNLSLSATQTPRRFDTLVLYFSGNNYPHQTGEMDSLRHFMTLQKILDILGYLFRNFIGSSITESSTLSNFLHSFIMFRLSKIWEIVLKLILFFKYFDLGRLLFHSKNSCGMLLIRILVGKGIIYQDRKFCSISWIELDRPKC